MDIRPFRVEDAEQVVQLWVDCGLTRPWNNPHKDIERKLLVQPELFLVGELEGRIVGSVMAGYEGHRGWVNYLAVSPTLQTSGLGRQLMSDVEERLLALGCPKVNLQVREGNDEAMAFYRRLGYTEDRAVGYGLILF